MTAEAPTIDEQLATVRTAEDLVPIVFHPDLQLPTELSREIADVLGEQACKQ